MRRESALIPFRKLGWLAAIVPICALSGWAAAQAPDVPIEIETPIETDESIIKSASQLREQGKLLSVAQVAALLESPQPAKVTLPAPFTRELSPAEVYRRARGAFVRIGWLVKSSDDETWQLDVANGYAIAKGGVVATAAHVLEPPEETEEAYLIGITADGGTLAVVSVLAIENDLDAAVVRVDGFAGAPLPLNENISPGDRAYCFSDPVGERGYFATGIVNRFCWSEGEVGDLKTLAGVRNLRVDVSTAWAPGSSGAAVLDSAGNAIGHVCTISGIEVVSDEPPAEDEQPRAASSEQDAGPNVEASSDEADDSEPTDDALPPASIATFVLNTATPARGVRLLVESMRETAAKPHAAASEQGTNDSVP